MSLKIRLISFILMLAVCCSMLSSCFLAVSVGEAMLEAASKEDATGNSSSEEESSNQVTVNPGEQEGSFQILGYTYALTQEDVDAFLALLTECEQTVKFSDKRQPVLESVEHAEDAFYDLQTQEQLAYIAYCIDGENELYKNAYDFSSVSCTNLYMIDFWLHK